MELHITTVYDKEAALALTRVAGMTAQKWQVRLSRGVEFLFAGVLLTAAAVLMWLGEYGAVTIFGLLIGVFALLSGIFYYRIAAFRSRRLMIKNATVQEVTLTDEAIFARNGVEESKLVYGVICALYQYSHYYFLFLDKRHGIILDENSISNGDSDALKNFLEEKCGKPIAALR